MNKDKLFFNKKYKTKEINDVLYELTWVYEENEKEIENKLKEIRKNKKISNNTKEIEKDIRRFIDILQDDYEDTEDEDVKDKIKTIFSESLVKVLALNYLNQDTIARIIYRNTNLLNIYGYDHVKWAMREYN